MNRKVWKTLTAVAVFVGMSVPIGGAAQAVSSQEAALAKAPNAAVRQQMRDQLDRAPGGKVTGPAQITYGNGAFVVDFAPPAGATTAAVLAAPNCPQYWVCFYDLTNYGYPRGKLQDCGQQDLATWGWRNRANSGHNNHTASSQLWDIDAYIGYVDMVPGQAVSDFGNAKNRTDLININCG
ncbi:hypothetical protein Q0Z83_046260 [Actinoplanes sichuanensis]|uniref:Peptidase inhibitor family I36 protein n=1 Tax=Actinoplanes sichuanensis TaxID=512349 RepID=A0ABW4A9D3_9ACTN|nr:peptidase inhibitor family I36 protein [Actinoplanes sichuanensis]BEL06435.1 hypothetical protein Q0Z83_046260 [Actinoplanes sichuanensis]